MCAQWICIVVSLISLQKPLLVSIAFALLVFRLCGVTSNRRRISNVLFAIRKVSLPNQVQMGWRQTSSSVGLSRSLFCGRLFVSVPTFHVDCAHLKRPPSFDALIVKSFSVTIARRFTMAYRYYLAMGYSPWKRAVKLSIVMWINRPLLDWRLVFGHLGTKPLSALTIKVRRADSSARPVRISFAQIVWC